MRVLSFIPIDAMVCQTEIAEKIIDAKADYLPAAIGWTISTTVRDGRPCHEMRYYIICTGSSTSRSRKINPACAGAMPTGTSASSAARR